METSFVSLSLVLLFRPRLKLRSHLAGQLAGRVET